MQSTSPPNSQKRARVLVVEDSAPDQLLIRKALEASTWVKEVYVVERAEDAIEFLRKKGDFHSVPRPDIIICDLHLPGKDGQFVLSEVKTSHDWMTIPMVMFSTSAGEETISSAYSTGAEIYLRKPFELDALFRMMENLGTFWESLEGKPQRERRRTIREKLRRHQTVVTGGKLTAILEKMFHRTDRTDRTDTDPLT